MSSKILDNLNSSNLIIIINNNKIQLSASHFSSNKSQMTLSTSNMRTMRTSDKAKLVWTSINTTKKNLTIWWLKTRDKRIMMIYFYAMIGTICSRPTSTITSSLTIWRILTKCHKSLSLAKGWSSNHLIRLSSRGFLCRKSSHRKLEGWIRINNKLIVNSFLNLKFHQIKIKCKGQVNFLKIL